MRKSKMWDEETVCTAYGITTTMHHDCNFDSLNHSPDLVKSVGMHKQTTALHLVLNDSPMIRRKAMALAMHPDTRSGYSKAKLSPINAKPPVINTSSLS